MNDWCNGDKQIRALLDEFIGALLFRDQRFKQTFMLYGQGNCGKSSFFKLLRTFISGHNTSDISLRQFGGHTSSAIQGKRLNISDDVGKQLDDEQHENLKKLISGDEITIDPKYKNPVTFKPQIKCIISCNEIPFLVVIRHYMIVLRSYRLNTNLKIQALKTVSRKITSNLVHC